MTTHPITAEAISPDPAWRSTATLAEIARRVGAAGRVTLLTHGKPDGDALGATLGLARAIASTGASATPWYAGPMPSWSADIIGPTPFHHADRGPPPGPEPDAVVIADTGSWAQLDDHRAWIEDRLDRTIVIDHHLQGDPEVAAVRYIDPAAAAVCDPVAEVCRLLTGAATTASLPASIAEPLYLGVATDTGWFRHSNVTPRALRLAADLIQAGVDHARLYSASEQNDRPARLWLMARALASAELAAAGRAVVMVLRQEDFRASGAEAGDSGGFADHGLAVRGVEVAAVLTELYDAKGVLTKISLRSRPHTFDVNRVANELGGGGHVNAAGARLRLGVFEARQRVVEILSR